MAPEPDLQTRVDTIVNNLNTVCSDLEELQEHGLDQTRAQRLKLYTAAVGATLEVLIDYFVQFPDLKPTTAMTPLEERAYRQGRGKILSFPKSDTDHTKD